MRKKILAAMVALATPYANAIPITKIFAFGNQDITYQINFYDQQNQSCRQAITKTTRINYSDTNPTWYAIQINKPDNLPTSCVSTSVEILSTYVYCTEMSGWGYDSCNSNYQITFNSKACLTAPILLAEQSNISIIRLNIEGQFYRGEAYGQFCPETSGF